MKNLDKFLRFKEVARLTGLSRTTIWRRQKSGEFPEGRKISKHRVGFLLSEVESWMRAIRR